jgi:SSS family solute:Na+ symporter
VGRVATGILVVLGLLWIPFMKYISSQLYLYMQSVQAYIAPPIAGCFLLGLFVPRLNGPGAVASLLTGFVLGAGRLALELVNGPAHTGLPPGSLWAWIAGINFLHYAVLLFAVCTVVLVGVSLATPAPDLERIRDLTYQRARADAGSVVDRRRDAGLSMALAVVLVGLWIVFR